MSGWPSACRGMRLVRKCRSILSACLMRFSNSRNPNFFSAQNNGLIREFKALSLTGVLRLGGNTSEFAYWKPKPDSPEPEHPQVREVVGEPKARYYAVTPEAVRNLAEFLQTAGWNCVYGIGMGTNAPARATEEAVFVAETLGDRLQYFQIGNEPDLFDHHLRDPKTWSAKAYLEEWLSLARAIAARVPAAKFGMPDVAGAVSWLTEIADQWPSIQNPPHVTTLTHHYYFGGPATNPDVNIPNLLKPATMQRVQNTANIASAAASKMSARVRMTEGNTCYRGGKPGVSDVFAAALWSADYSLLLASNDYSGINLHGGTGKSVANSVGGSLPGDALLEAKWRNSRTDCRASASFLYTDWNIWLGLCVGAGRVWAQVCGIVQRRNPVEHRVLDEAAGCGSQCDSLCRETACRANVRDHSEQGRDSGP